MIRFLLKGLLRDRSRSILPIIIVSIGVALTVFLIGYIEGAMGDVTDQNARFETGHVKVMTKAYAENKDQLPNDLALLGVDELVSQLNEDYPELTWVKRVKFGGLIDAFEADGSSKGQGPAVGMAFEIMENGGGEVQRLNLVNSLVSGVLPNSAGEVLLGDQFAGKLKVKLGDTITYFGSTMNGSMTFKNFVIVGTIRFGTPVLDKGAVVIDVADAQDMLDMEDGAGEILGYLPNETYYDEQALAVAQSFNENYFDEKDEFSPQMFSLKQQNNLGVMLDLVNVMSGIYVLIFVIAMSMVLWNTGLLGGLRRYQEFGIRLALGEAKGNIYRTLIMEAVLIGIIGSIVGTIIGLFFTYLLQVYGIDIGQYLPNSSMLFPNVIRAKITPQLFWIGFIPGLFAMVLGNMLSGYGIYKRETARLFKELEV
ncbi:MAG: ABC transporter permease [Bacteroidia bacterium]